MAEHTHTTYSCDRCKADLGSERPKRTQETDITAWFNYREGPGPNFKWKDLCDECDKQAKAFFLPDGMYPAAAEKSDARAWFETVLLRENRDQSDYIMVRAKRMIGDWRP